MKYENKNLIFFSSSGIGTGRNKQFDQKSKESEFDDFFHLLPDFKQ